MSERSVAIIGASSDRSKFGNKAVRAFKAAGWRVFPIHPSETSVEGISVFPSVTDVPEAVEIATLYVAPPIGRKLLPDLVRKGVREVWVNPGAGDAALLAEAGRLGMKHRSLCSIIEVGRSPRDFPDL